jgi:Family of unknown function (DUF6057)
MQNQPNRTKYIKDIFLNLLPYLIYFACLFIYFGYFAAYVQFFQEKSSLFICSSDFLRENLNQPGALLIYLSKFLTTFYFYPLAGAVIISAIPTLLLFTVAHIIRNFTGKKSFFIPFILGSALLSLQTDYRYFLFNSLGLLLQVAAFYLHIRLSKYTKGWISILLSPAWYFISGGFSLLFFLMLTFGFIAEKNRIGLLKIIALWCIILGTFYLSKEYLFFQTGQTLLTFPYSELNTGSHSKLFLSVAVLISTLPFLGLIKLNIPEKFFPSVLCGSLILSALFILSATAIGMKQSDQKSKNYFQVEKLFYENKFDELVAYNTKNKTTNSLTLFLNNIALCETGKLNDLLFHFPQSADGKTLFLKWKMEEEVLKRGGYFYYTIGMINEAHRWAFENMVMKGHTPEGLKMLIKTELILGNYRVASKYTDLLKQTFFYQREAEQFEKLLFNDGAINADPELGEKRNNKINTDFFALTDEPLGNVYQILAKDSLNKKAFEYKLAFMLLKKDYKGIAMELPRMEQLGYPRLPTHIEEVAAALTSLKMGAPEPGRIQMNTNTLLRWKEYLTILKQHGSNAAAAEPFVRNQFADTFWYYAFYR